MVVDWLIDVVASYFVSGFAEYWLAPLLCIYLIGCLSDLIRYMFSWR